VLSPWAVDIVIDMSRVSLAETCPRFKPPAVWVSYGHAIYLGPSLGLAPHSAAVDCLALGVETGFIVRSPEFEDHGVRSVLVPARSRHQILSAEGLMMFAYFDPGGARARECRRRMAGAEHGFGFNHDAETELIRLCCIQSPDPVKVLDCAAQRVVGAIDPRIAAAIDMIRTEPARSDPAAEIARKVGLSRSYFLRLFTAQTGTSFRRYRMWARMLYVVQQISHGYDLTGAAIEAGFASPSHFSDTFNDMFGLTASKLLNTGVTLTATGDCQSGFIAPDPRPGQHASG
jgi:AraC-like DNA-binding protein